MLTLLLGVLAQTRPHLIPLECTWGLLLVIVVAVFILILIAKGR